MARQAEVEIVNKLGLHARASAKLTQTASKYASEVWLTRNGRRVNAKSIMGVMMLAAGKGSKVAIETSGEDEQAALDALMALIADIKAAKEAGVPDEQLKEARACQRRGQFFVDFVEAENSSGFHAPQEAVRILGEAIDLFRKGQVSLRPMKGAPGARAGDR